MYKLSIAILVLTLSACASTDVWRDLQIDGSNSASVNESVATIQRALPEWRRERFDMVLADLWITRQITSEAAGANYSENEYFASLDGLSYDEVLDLAGPETTPRYWAVRSHPQQSAASRNEPWSGTDPYRFPSYVQPPPGIANIQ